MTTGIMTLGTGTRLGRYEIRSKIGEGGMGEVYLVQRGEFMFTRMTTSLLLILCGSVSAMSPSVVVEKSCREHPQVVGECFNVHGRLSIYNGNPAVRLWNLRTRRMLGVSDQRFSIPGYLNMPEDLAKQLDGNSNIYGDFLICPFTRPRPREMQLMCIESAKNVVVKKRE